MNYRHGDLFIKRVEKKPGKVKHTKLTLALGEVTGHSHTLYGLNGGLIVGDKGVFEVVGDVELRHEEHDTIRLAPGVYEITHENEYDYFENEIKTVVD